MPEKIYSSARKIVFASDDLGFEEKNLFKRWYHFLSVVFATEWVRSFSQYQHVRPRELTFGE